MTTKPRTNLTRRLLILWLGLRGSVEFRLGSREDQLDQAKATFDRLAELDQLSFLAHIHLGQIAERRLQAQAALGHYALAFQIDSERFDRAPVAAEIKRRIAAHEALIRAGRGGRKAPEAFSAALSHADEARREESVPTRNDFSSPAEWRRFRGRPPISREEIDRADLDDLLRRLSQGD